MKKTLAATLLVITLAAPSFAAVKSDPDRRSGASRSAITRVLKLVGRFLGISVNDGGDIVIPRP